MSNKYLKWCDEFGKALPSDRTCFLIVEVQLDLMSKMMEIGSMIYEVIDNEISNYVVSIDMELWKKIPQLDIGISIFKYDKGNFLEQKYIPHYNIELFLMDRVSELIMFQEYNLKPIGDDRKEMLSNSIELEKIKETLVYACYSNNTNKIFSCLEKISATQLNRKIKYHETPLGFCVLNDNLEAFKAVAEKGADLNKRSLKFNPLKIAFATSPDIVLYIYQNYKEQFDKEVSALGFYIAYRTTDIRILEILKDYGCDMNDSSQKFSPLHCFADVNNVSAIQFFADNGANLSILNSDGETALDRAKIYYSKEAVELLEELTKN